MRLRAIRVGLLACLLLVTLGCGGDNADESATPPDEPGRSGEDDGKGEDTPRPGTAGTISQIADCGAFQEAATAILDASSLTVDDSAPNSCQYFDQSGADGRSGRLFLTTDGSSFIDTLDPAMVLGFSYDEERTRVDSNVEGWSLSAQTSSSEPHPDFPQSKTEHALVLGGDGIQGNLKCRLVLSQTGEGGSEPPPPPTVDRDAFEAFCNFARDALFAE